MEEINNKFKGIELAVINPQKKEEGILKNIKSTAISMILGDRQGFTIIGPATIVKQIKKDPDKIELFTKDIGSKKSRS